MSDYSRGSSYPNRSSQRQVKPQTKPAVEIRSFYAQGKDVPESDLFDKKALEIAESFVIDDSGRRVGVSSTQFRRIFDEVKRYERVLSGNEEKWAEQLPYIKMIKSKVAYTVARAIKKKPKEEGVYKNFEKFISQGINLIKTEKDYHVFVALFESV